MTIDLPVLTPTRRAFLIAVAATTASSATPGAETSEAADLIVEIRQSFTLRGKPIPPEIFRDFGDGNLADGAPIWTAVDLDAAVGSNQYFDSVRTNGAWIVQGRAAGNGHKVLEYLYANPIVSVNDVQAQTGTTYQAANGLVGKLVGSGILREFTGHARNRRFIYDPYIKLFYPG